MSDSRIKLLEWANEITQLHFNKVEQLGTGIAYSKILDSIYGDVQLSKLKYNDQNECAYIDNFKIIQKTFKKHNIDKPIPVDRLVKCRFQDNLEFLKWLKSFWDKNYHGQSYNEGAKRQKVSTHISNDNPFINHDNKRTNHLSSSSTTITNTISTQQRSSGSNKITQLQQKIAQLETTISSIQEEKQLYLLKLESIKRVVIKSESLKCSKPGSLVNTLKKIWNILYNEKDDLE